ncbi:MAG: SGNH/GDSL hydrolase family protein [Deltaproteobacteria bacterium]|nr:MAG: SGNH/GDSL hydrolase family protein [Deltaproteobacteria bacterium]
MNSKKIKLYAIGTVLVVTSLFGTIELTTRLTSLFSGKGFVLNLHEYDAYDSQIKHLYQWHPFTGITFRPDITFKGSHPHQTRHPSIFVDHYGFLSDGQTLTADKQVDEIRIAAIGSSTTANINLSYSENWPGYLGTSIQKALPNKKIRIINAGVPGFDTAQSVCNLALRVMPLKPDIVIIYHAYNDLKAIRKNEAFKPDYSHIHKKPLYAYIQPNPFIRGLNHSMIYVRTRNRHRQHKREKAIIENIKNMQSSLTRLDYVPKEAQDAFRQHMHILISIAQSGGAHVILSSFATLHNPNSSARGVMESKQATKLQKSELLLIGHFVPGLTIDAVFRGINQYNEFLRALALEQHLGWVDNATTIPHDERYFVDRIHFTREGAALMAKNLFPVVIQEINKL